ncbi:DUF6894 family protein [Muricoccus radiodurans]|uniref:DUF6894 family protein n=1 Tax=Muricoccus radiodurans TaxID=2231721 RepID=UPI003CEB0E8C
MLCFYFDPSDGSAEDRNVEGSDLSDRASARRATLTSLRDMVWDQIAPGGRRAFKAVVRDQAGSSVYAATLSLDEGWRS